MYKATRSLFDDGTCMLFDKLWITYHLIIIRFGLIGLCIFLGHSGGKNY